ncbi:hypothetical protein K1719_033638 [Acacia pycnantha]|nr:hypothetical protein K1719_033638 [Acacia pycnantha]
MHSKFSMQFSRASSCIFTGLDPRSSSNSPTSWKQLRDGSIITQANSQKEKPCSENGVLIPKTLRIDDPTEAAKSSIWSTYLILATIGISVSGIVQVVQTGVRVGCERVVRLEEEENFDAIQVKREKVKEEVEKVMGEDEEESKIIRERAKRRQRRQWRYVCENQMFVKKQMKR